MKLFHAALAFAFAALSASAADWRDSLTKKPGKFSALRPLTAHYEFGWSGVTAAKADAKFSHPKNTHRLDLTVATLGLARTLWRMDSVATSICNAATLRPLRLTQVETYSRKKLTTTVDFKADGPERLKVPEPPDKTPPKPKRFKFAEVHDMQSALLFSRSQPLRDGETLRLCVYPGSSPYYAELRVVGREKVKVAGVERAAIRCDVKLREVKKDFTLATHKKFKSATVWLSDDKDRMLLKMNAEVFIGSVWAELKAVEFAGGKK